MSAQPPAVLDQDPVPGGVISFTPPSKTMCGGEDWLEVSLYVNWNDEFDALRKRLDQAQEAAQQAESGQDEIQFNEYGFIVSRSGGFLGKAPKGLWMHWQLQSEFGPRMMIRDRKDAHATQPSVFVRATSTVMMSMGLSLVWQLVQGWVRAMGGTLVHNKVSRVDPCVDLAGVGIETIMEAYRNDWIIARGRNRSTHNLMLPIDEYGHGRKPTGFRVGKHPLMIRVYDKLHESRFSAAKRQVLIDRRWGCVPEGAIRAEFELGRKRLHRLGIESVDDWFRCRGSVCEYLCAKWFRMTACDVDRNHADRTPTHPIWNQVRQAFADWCGSLSYEPLAEVAPIGKVEVALLIKQVIGTAITAFAESGEEIADTGHFLGELVGRIGVELEKRDVADEVRRRRVERGIAALNPPVAREVN